MRIDEFSAPSEIDGTFTPTERTRFSCFGLDIIATTTAPIKIRIDEFSTPSDIDGSFTTEERTRFLTLGFSKALAVETVIGWSEKYYFKSPIYLEHGIKSEVSLSKLIKSYIIDEEQDE